VVARRGRESDAAAAALPPLVEGGREEEACLLFGGERGGSRSRSERKKERVSEAIARRKSLSLLSLFSTHRDGRAKARRVRHALAVDCEGVGGLRRRRLASCRGEDAEGAARG